jgi:hypothetical protein
MVFRTHNIRRSGNKLVADEDSNIAISNTRSKFIHWVLYQDGLPKLIGHGSDGTASKLLSFKGRDLKGSYTLKVRAYTSRGMEIKLDTLLDIV